MSAVNRMSFKERMARYVRHADLFGYPIQLRYKDDTNFKSLPGGLMSIVIFIAVLCYSILILYQTINLSVFSVTSSKLPFDSSND